MRPQTQPTLLSSCPADRLWLRFPISDKSVLSAVGTIFLVLLLICSVHQAVSHCRLLDHLTIRRSRAERNLRRRSSQPSLSLSFLLTFSSRTQERTGVGINPHSMWTGRACAAAHAFGEGEVGRTAEERNRWTPLLGVGVESAPPA